MPPFTFSASSESKNLLHGGGKDCRKYFSVPPVPDKGIKHRYTHAYILGLRLSV